MERSRVIDEVDNLRLIQTLQKHTSDLAGKRALHPLDERIQAISQDLFVLWVVGAAAICGMRVAVPIQVGGPDRRSRHT